MRSTITGAHSSLLFCFPSLKELFPIEEKEKQSFPIGDYLSVRGGEERNHQEKKL
jgi:hypothetical protein